MSSVAVGLVAFLAWCDWRHQERGGVLYVPCVAGGVGAQRRSLVTHVLTRSMPAGGACQVAPQRISAPWLTA